MVFGLAAAIMSPVFGLMLNAFGYRNMSLAFLAAGLAYFLFPLAGDLLDLNGDSFVPIFLYQR